MRLRKPRRIAPRLANGGSRDNYAGRLPPHVKRGLQMKAAAEGRSVSWLLEEAMIDHFGLKRPEYAIPETWKEEDRPRLRRIK